MIQALAAEEDPSEMTQTNPNKTATLVCQECGGMGGYTEIVITETGEGPWYDRIRDWRTCTWCEGTRSRHAASPFSVVAREEVCGQSVSGRGCPSACYIVGALR